MNEHGNNDNIKDSMSSKSSDTFIELTDDYIDDMFVKQESGEVELNERCNSIMETYKKLYWLIPKLRLDSKHKKEIICEIKKLQGEVDEGLKGFFGQDFKSRDELEKTISTMERRINNLNKEAVFKAKRNQIYTTLAFEFIKESN